MKEERIERQRELVSSNSAVLLLSLISSLYMQFLRLEETSTYAYEHCDGEVEDICDCRDRPVLFGAC